MAQQKVWEFKEMTLDFSSSVGTSTVQLYTDMPGGTLAARLSGKTLPNSSSVRQTRTIPLDGIEGTNFYPEITPAATTILRLFGGVILARPIGIYLDGALGEIWRTQPIALGV